MSIIGRLYNIARAGLSVRRSQRDHAKTEVGFDEDMSNMREYAQQTAEETMDPELKRYYANLEIPYGSDLETARKAWRHLLKKYHPDLHSNDPEKRRVAHELTQGLNRAFEELEKRLT